MANGERAQIDYAILDEAGEAVQWGRMVRPAVEHLQATEERTVLIGAAARDKAAAAETTRSNRRLGESQQKIQRRAQLMAQLEQLATSGAATDADVRELADTVRQLFGGEPLR